MVATVAVMSIGENYFNKASVNRSWKNVALTDNALYHLCCIMAAHHLVQCGTRDDLQFDDFSHRLMPSGGL